MVTIIKKKGKTQDLFYVYDYIYDKERKALKRVYIGTADEKAYKEYLNQKSGEDKYCKVCGKRKFNSLPDYLQGYKMKVCECK